MEYIKCGNVMEFIGDFTFLDALKRADRVGNWLHICSSDGVEFEKIMCEIYVFDLPDTFKEQLYSEKLIKKKIRMATCGVVTFVIFKEEKHAKN